jgi:hypothetical protein
VAPNLRKLSILGGFDYGGVTESLPLFEAAIFFGSNCAKFLTEMVGITKLDFSFISIWVRFRSCIVLSSVFLF